MWKPSRCCGENLQVSNVGAILILDLLGHSYRYMCLWMDLLGNSCLDTCVELAFKASSNLISFRVVSLELLVA